MGSDLDRREFLRRGVLAGAVVGALPLAASADPADAKPRVRRHATLGRTGLKISDISFGASRLDADADLVRHALELGVNYFDPAEGYRGGRSETVIGKALEGKRDQVFIASKVKCGISSTRSELMKTLEESLVRLQTDRIDVYFNHAVNDVRRLQNPEWFEFVERARKQGKIRFTGISGHGGRLVECIDHALDNDLCDVLLVGYNFGQDPAFYERFTRRFDFVAIQPDLPRVLAKAREKNVGVIAMKTLMGAKLNDLRPYENGGATFSQAAFRWVLANPDVDALIVSMTGREQIDEYLGASGWRRSAWSDPRLLERYARANARSHCRHGCGACLDSCPQAVEIPEVLRTRMYARDYADEELARHDYARIETDATACLTCADQACAAACPYGLPIAELTEGTHGLLS